MHRHRESYVTETDSDKLNEFLRFDKLTLNRSIDIQQ